MYACVDMYIRACLYVCYTRTHTHTQIHTHTHTSNFLFESVCFSLQELIQYAIWTAFFFTVVVVAAVSGYQSPVVIAVAVSLHVHRMKVLKSFKEHLTDKSETVIVDFSFRLSSLSILLTLAISV